MAKTAKTAKSTVTAEQVASAFAEAIRLSNLYNGASSDAPVAEVEADEDEVEDEDDEEVEEVELTQEMIDTAAGEGIKSLRTLAQEVLGEDAPTKKAEILEALAELVEEDEEEDEDDEDEVEEVEEDDEADEDDEDEDDEDEEEGYDRDELEELDLKALRKIAKEEGHSAADYKGMDQDALIDLILGEEEAEDEDEDEDEEVEELDEDALNEMSQKELLGLAKELGVKVPKAQQKQSKSNHKKIVALILDSGEEE